MFDELRSFDGFVAGKVLVVGKRDRVVWAYRPGDDKISSAVEGERCRKRNGPL